MSERPRSVKDTGDASAGRPRPLEGQVVLVTGAARRIGRAIALRLAADGAKIAIHYGSSAAEAERTAREAGGGARIYRADLRSVAEVRRLAAEVGETMGRIDGLVNNASTFGRTPFEETTEEEWDLFHDVNLKAVFFLTQAVAARMREGSIVNIADTAGVNPWPGYLAYAASKAGLIGLTRGLAARLAPRIRVNAILPGPILAPEAAGAESLEEAVKRTLLRRPGSPDDIAAAVRFLFVDGTYVTGALLPVDGGRLAAGA
ncbi:MAG: SDR family oxidoreductase [Candidatus Latescibacterota bacterium]|nr:MAG: SDR family oxidoreductase [Candidatus Latescibacterota bacterium]